MFNFNTLYDSFVCTIDNVFIIAPKKQIIKKVRETLFTFKLYTVQTSF